MMRILIIIFSMTFLSCSTKNVKFLNYIPTEYQTDSTIITRPLALIEAMRIEENNPIILNQISYIDIDSVSNEFILIDPPSKCAVKYDYHTGRIISFLKAGLELSDSVANSGRPAQRFKNKTFKYIVSDEYKKYQITSSDFKFAQSTFRAVQYSGSDRILLLSIIYTPAITQDSFQILDKKEVKIIDNNTAVVECNYNLKIKKVTVFENQDLSYIVPWNFLYEPNEKVYYITTTNYSHYEENNLDSLTAIAKTDEVGDQVEISSFLPDKYIQNKAGYKIFYVPSITNLGKELFISFPYDINIYGLYNTLRFPLKNLPFSNDSGFMLLEIIEDYYSHGTSYENSQNHKSTLTKAFPVCIIRLFGLKNSICTQILITDPKEKNGYYYILQEYDKSGKLMSHTKVVDDLTNPIKLITYDKYNGYVVFIRKSKEGWSLEKRRWE